MLPLEKRVSTVGCCHGSGPRSSQTSSPSPAGRAWDIAAGALSLGVWMLIPKCPVCLAAHVALWTGLGLSFAEASYLRWSLLLVSGVLLIYVVVRQRASRFWLARSGRACSARGRDGLDRSAAS
jgi:hypothetical protein